MNIRSRLRLSFIFTLAAAISVAAILLVANHLADQERTQIENVQAIQENLYSLDHLTLEYLMSPELRVAAQWKAGQDELGKHLLLLAPATPEGKAIGELLRQNNDRSRMLYDQLVALGPEAERSSGGKILSGQLQLKIQSMVSGALQMEMSMRQKVAATRNLLSVLLAVLMAALVAVVAGGSLLFSKSILKPLNALRKGMDVIGAGNLEYRVDLTMQDEIGDLARSFDHMVKNLRQAGQELRSASLYARSLIEASLDPLVTISLEGKITDVNKASEEVTGWSRSELVGTDFSDYFTEPDKAREGYQQVFVDGTVTDYPLVIRHRDGHVTDVLYNASVYRNEAGEVLGVFAAARDITERKEIEQKLRDSDERLQLTLEAARIGIWDWDIKKDQYYASPVYYTMLGYEAKAGLADRNEWLDRVHPEDRNLVREQFQNVLSRRTEHYSYEARFLHADGSYRWQQALGYGVEVDADGKVGRMLGIRLDINDRKQAELRLLKSEQEFRTLAENSPDVIVRYDRQGRRIYVNPAFESVNHLSAREVYGKNPIELSTELKPKADVFTEQLMAAMASGTPVKVDLAWIKDGKLVCWFVRVVPEFDADGKVVSAITIWSDISERKQAEDELREKENYSQSLLRLSRGMERSQTYAEVLNAAQEEIKEIIGYQSLWVYLLSDDKQYLKATVAGGEVSDTVMSDEGTATLTIKGDRMLEEIAASKEIVLVEDARADDRVNKEIVARLGMRTILNIPIMLFDRHLGCVGMGTFGDEGVRVPSPAERKYLISMASHMAVALDRVHLLAERRKTEIELRESEDKFKYVFDHSPVGKTLTLPSGLLEVNHAFCEILGYSEKELGYTRWQDITYPDDIELTQRAIDQLLSEKQNSVRFVKRYLHKNGSVVWVDVVTSLRRDAEKKPLYFLTSIIDITERKRAEEELRSSHEHLEALVRERTGKLEDANKELESFSYSVSHDLRTPLRAIDGFCHILMDDYSEKLDDEGKRLLNVVRDNTQKMGQLIDDILAFSRTGRVGFSFSEIDMEGLARAVVEELKPSGGNLHVEIETIPPSVGDHAMMHQVFVNLLSNAIKFSRRKENAIIKVGGSIQGNEAVYFVKDNGAGFDMKYVDKLFGVFQRLHAVNDFEGTGIGLAIVKRIITRHGGRVWAEGQVNEGATIYFALPTKETNNE
jgi:PAS domain S-box-containing protein